MRLVQQWTGAPQAGCPWWALRDPFVARVVRAYPWFEKGQLETFEPQPSNRLVEGISYYGEQTALCESKQIELDREEAKATAKKRR